jgi:hypothetical protein
MKRVAIVVLLLAFAAFSQEVKRPTADSDPGGLRTECGGTNYLGWTAGDTLTADGEIFAPGPVEETNNLKTSWQSATAPYTSLTLSATSTCSGTNTGSCSIYYSLNSGSSWISLKSGSTWTLTTTTVTLSNTQVLGNVQLLYCAVANDGSSGGNTGHRTLTVSDAYTTGTLATTKRKQTTQQ